MPKMKTHKGAAKRFKVTGTGKIRRSQAGRGHLKLAKSRKRFRTLKNDANLAKGDERNVKRMIGR
jgi:large subunit ribosomal protein L35